MAEGLAGAMNQMDVAEMRNLMMVNRISWGKLILMGAMIVLAVTAFVYLIVAACDPPLA